MTKRCCQGARHEEEGDCKLVHDAGAQVGWVPEVPPHAILPAADIRCYQVIKTVTDHSSM
jgi:hypothetical protein